MLETQSLEFAQLVFGLALVQYFLTMLPSLCLGTVYLMPSYVRNFTGITFKKLHESQKRLWT